VGKNQMQASLPNFVEHRREVVVDVFLKLV
jgi:hypothetical protein